MPDVLSIQITKETTLKDVQELPEGAYAPEVDYFIAIHIIKKYELKRALEYLISAKAPELNFTAETQAEVYAAAVELGFYK